MYYRLKRLIKDGKYNTVLLIAAAVAMLLAAAVFFIYFYGNNETISIQSSAESRLPDENETESSVVTGASGTVFVDVSGCVKHPGVYEVPPGSRIFEVIEEAGGFTKNADTALINQAETVTDGMKINVQDKRKTSGGSSSGQQAASYPVTTNESMININTADSQTLQKIPGIGPVTAEKIIRYREDYGAFRSVDEITNVSGIGEKTLEKMRPMITV